MVRGAWSNWDAANAADVWATELGDMTAQFGREAVEEGILVAIRDTHRPGCQFAPSLPELRRYVQDNSATRLVGVTDSNCRECNGTGWAPSKQQPGSVTRCSCWHKRAVSA